MYSLNVNTDALAKWSNEIDKIGRFNIPIAARRAINSTAFDVKKRTLIQETNIFTKRKPSFFKAFSQVKPARQLKLKDIKAVVGMTDRKRGGQSEQAGRNMEQRQLGGTIGGRSYIPLENARIGKNEEKNIRKNYRISNVLSRRTLNTSKMRGNNPRQKYAEALRRAKKGDIVIHKGVVFSVTGKAKMTPIYTYQENRSVKAGKTSPFTRKAALKSQKLMESFYIKEAKKIIKFKKL